MVCKLHKFFDQRYDLQIKVQGQIYVKSVLITARNAISSLIFGGGGLYPIMFR